MTILKSTANTAHRWGIVLSGGDGTRLQDFIYRRRGDHLPKQYVNFIGTRSMLEHTWHRAEKLIPAKKLLTILTRAHLQFEEARSQAGRTPQECVIIQPENKDTGPGIVLPLMHIDKRDSEAVVAIFPSDHFVLEEKLFMRHVERVFEIVESNGSLIVLLGMEPSEPDPEYGYIVPGRAVGSSELDSRAVEMFLEKPSAQAARKIMNSGALWNTLVVVASCKTLLQAIERATPELYHSFEPIRAAIGTPDESRVIREVYQKLHAVNISKSVLEALSHEHRRALVVCPVRGVTWSDWGTAARLSRTLERLATLNPSPGRDAGQKSAPVMSERRFGTAIKSTRDVAQKRI